MIRYLVSKQSFNSAIMEKKNLIGVSYVSALIIIWGTIGSLIDFALLQSEVYKVGSLGQILTFSITGFIFIYFGVKLFSKTKEIIFEKNKKS